MTHGCYAHDNICICFSLFLCFSNSFPSCSFSFYRPWGIFCYSVNSHDPRPLTTRPYLSLSFSFAISSFRRGSFSLWPFLVLFIPLTFKDFFKLIYLLIYFNWTSKYRAQTKETGSRNRRVKWNFLSRDGSLKVSRRWRNA